MKIPINLNLFQSFYSTSHSEEDSTTTLSTNSMVLETDMEDGDKSHIQMAQENPGGTDTNHDDNSVIVESKDFFTFQKEITDNDITYRYGYFVNSRNLKLVCQEFIPSAPKGIVVILHGYADHSHSMLKEDAQHFAKQGFASFIFDQQGHGHSEGLSGYIEDFEDLVDDSILFIEELTKRFPENLKKFIYSSSMGSAVALSLSLRKPEFFTGGMVLLAPMIKLDESMVPSPLVIQVLSWISYAFPSLPIVPGENVLDKSIKDPQKRIEHANHPLTYKGRARLATGLAILKVTDYLQSRLHDVTVPLIVLHGSLDKVTSPAVSEQLYNQSSSVDKTIKIYPDFWHSLTCEPDSYLVYNDITNWINDRL
ncbi:putative phospholipase [Tieghemostelium lacteum]|uniref:Putative phospholipase n=1 Tax=Tieghemostelium lacteum TaxID=361077 RepID=A0A151Z687_TIELA|nr:putative phospholipase [Tieghemostelium lacteum]|eukprot:KYQ89470.1 putative phospholipase [Tieghemostelium lacteum]